MNWKKWLVLVMSSVWFFPVSCTSTMITGMYASSYLGANHHEQGDPVPHYFSVAIFDQPDGSFRLERLRKTASTPMSAFKPTAQSASRPHPSHELGHQRYQAMDANRNLIEVIDYDDPYTFYSVYRVDSDKITPIYSRVFGLGEAILGFFIALPIGIIIHELGRWLKRRFYPESIATKSK
ncbi:hypothetical protein ABHF33_03000 [Chitinibacter sp. FCG-7]|uniref:DUF3592 domain-containing protein n=1 Tax=Chitinibacter mangrovi TaxID=3153927 RepID=A0AAU7FCN2_9NEIS